MTAVTTVADDEYMTVEEFAALSSDVHHAVWKAHAEHRIDAVPARPYVSGSVCRYNREQVLEIATTAVTARPA